MQNTQYNNLTLYEGQDIFNPLIVENGNMEEVDRLIHNNDIASVGLATELKSGTVHALTRVAHEDAPMFRFVATSRFDAGDTFTVDGIQVSALLSDGTTLSDGAYVINSNVLCCLTGTVLTMYTVPGAIQTAQNALKLGGELPSYYGKDSDVQNALTTANAAGVLARNLEDELINYDFSNTSMTPTNFKDMIQQILNKVFPKALNIVKNGVTNVPFDNTVYRRAASYNAVTTQWAYDATKLLNHGIIGIGSGCAGFATNNAIDLRGYNTLTVIGRVLQTNALVTKTLDISNIDNGYIVLNMSRDAYNTSYLSVFVSSTKQDYATNKLADVDVEYTSNTTTSNYAQIVDIVLS